MADPRFQDDEELAKLKDWWQENRWALIGGIVLGLGGVVGWNGWQTYSQSRAETASALFTRAIDSQAGGNVEPAVEAAEALIRDYASTPYAGKAALLLARIAVDGKDLAQARTRLRWAMDNADDPATGHAARLRLAALHLGANEAQQALDLLAVPDQGGFRSRYRELAGDAHLRLGNADKARAAYQEALDALPLGSNYRQYLAMKLDGATGGAGR